MRGIKVLTYAQETSHPHHYTTSENSWYKAGLEHGFMLFMPNSNPTIRMSQQKWRVTSSTKLPSFRQFWWPGTLSQAKVTFFLIPKIDGLKLLTGDAHIRFEGQVLAWGVWLSATFCWLLGEGGVPMRWVSIGKFLQWHYWKRFLGSSKMGHFPSCSGTFCPPPKLLPALYLSSAWFSALGCCHVIGCLHNCFKEQVYRCT